MATIARPETMTDPLVEPQAGRTRAGAARLDAIDMLRGLVIALMVLDHVRDFFHADAFLFDPTDPARTTPLLFVTRWLTHLCAPTFVFLAGVSIDFQKVNGKGDRALTRFLLTRGAWLILLEATLVGFGFNFAPILFFQVIWAIGASMIAMAALVRLPRPAVGAVGLALILATGALLAWAAGQGEAAARAQTAHPLMTFAFVPGLFPWGLHGIVMYPFVPWLGVMCLGYAAGPLFRLNAGRRDLTFLTIGLGLIGAFLIVRGLNGLGDFKPWTPMGETARTVMSFMDVGKYPPSPDYVMATLGVSALLFVGLGRVGGIARDVLLAWGRTPLFTYLCHLYIAHGLALMVGVALGFSPALFVDLIMGENGLPKSGWGFGLPVVYGVWLLVLALLYPLSRWFAGVKRRRRDWWLGYL